MKRWFNQKLFFFIAGCQMHNATSQHRTGRTRREVGRRNEIKQHRFSFFKIKKSTSAKVKAAKLSKRECPNS